MSTIRRVAGITLIELLIVIAIMATVLGLVGGNSMDAVDRVSSQTEVVSFYGLIKKSSVEAFSSGGGLVIEFEEDKVSIYNRDGLLSSKRFKYLTFEQQQLRFDRNGSPSVLQLMVKVRNTEKRVDLRPLFADFVISGDPSATQL